MDKYIDQYCGDCEAKYTVIYEADDPPICCAFCGSVAISESDSDAESDDETTTED